MDYASAAKELLELHVQICRMKMNLQMDTYAKGEMRVLNYLYEHGGKAYPVDISRDLEVSSARVAVLVNHLAEKGWAARSTDQQNSRHTVVALLLAGEQALLQEKQTTLKAIATSLERIGEEDAAEYLRIRRKIVEGYQSSPLA